MPLHTYPIFISEDRLFIELPEGPFLLNSGSPMSFGNTGTITYCGQRRNLPASAMGVNMDAVRKLVDGPCNGLLGIDVLGLKPMHCSLRTGQIHIGELPHMKRGIPLACTSVYEIPMIPIQSRGQKAWSFFDTGAKYGYALGLDLVDGLHNEGEIEDYNPLLGDIGGPSWSLPYRLLDENNVSVGPDMEEVVGNLDIGLLRMAGAELIIGWHLLESVDILAIPDIGIEIFTQPQSF